MTLYSAAYALLMLEYSEADVHAALATEFPASTEVQRAVAITEAEFDVAEAKRDLAAIAAEFDVAQSMHRKEPT